MRTCIAFLFFPFSILFGQETFINADDDPFTNLILSVTDSKTGAPCFVYVSVDWGGGGYNGGMVYERHFCQTGTGITGQARIAAALDESKEFPLSMSIQLTYQPSRNQFCYGFGSITKEMWQSNDWKTPKFQWETSTIEDDKLPMFTVKLRRVRTKEPVIEQSTETDQKPTPLDDWSEEKFTLRDVFKDGIPIAPKSLTKMRTWTSIDGRTISAELAEFTTNRTSIYGKFRRRDGKLYTIPVHRFIKADRKILSELYQPQGQ